MWGPMRLVPLILAVFWLACPAAAQSVDEPKPNAKGKNDVKAYPIWRTDEGVHLKAMGMLLGQGTSVSVAGTPQSALLARRLFGEDPIYAEAGWQVVFDRAIPLPLKVIRGIKDDRPLPVIWDQEPAKLAAKADQHWYVAFIEALNNTMRTPEANFKKSAERFEHVVYPQLRATPWNYRGRILTVKGKLAMLRQVDAPRYSDKELEHIYTGYGIGPTPGAPPITIVLTELPPGVVAPSEKMDVQVTFLGYFLSFVRFPADKNTGRPKTDVLSLYLVGKVVSATAPTKVADKDAQPYSAGLIATVVGTFILIALAVVVMNVYLRRGDRQIHSKLAEVRDRHNPFTIEPVEEGHAPPKTDEEDKAPDAG